MMIDDGCATVVVNILVPIYVTYLPVESLRYTVTD